MSPLQYLRRFDVTKMLDMARRRERHGTSSPHVVARPVTHVPDSTGFRRGARGATSDAALNRSDAPRVKMNAVGLLKVLGRYRDRVDVEIAKASERGARWWSRRLVQLYKDAGLVRLDK
jgi:hypothetical protein